jgi:hypothetical protein
LFYTIIICFDFLNDKEPSLEPGPDGQTVYAAHVISAAILAPAQSSDIPKVTGLVISALNKY